MKVNTFTSTKQRFRLLFATATAVLLSFQLSAQLIIGWDVQGINQYGASPFAPTTLDPSLTMVTGLSRGSGLLTPNPVSAAAGAWGAGGGWGTTDAKSFFFVFKVNTGYTASLSKISSQLRKSNAGPSNCTVEYSVNGGSYTSVASWVSNSTSASGTANTTTLTSISGLQNIPEGTEIKFRFIFPGAATGGNFYFTSNADALKIEGVVTPITAGCSEPENINAANITHENADLSWDADAANSFEYVLNEDAAEPAAAGTAVAANTLNATDLEANTTYYFHLRKDCGDGNFSEWVTYSFTTEELPVSCPAPTNISAANITHEDADLSWDADAANSFEYVLNEDTAEPAAAGTAIPSNTLNATDLEANTTYYFHLRKDCGDGDFSTWVTYSFTTEELPVSCPAPTNISAANITHEDADLSWDADAANSFEYVLNEDAAEPAAAGTAVATNTLNATDLEANTTYYFHLRKDCGDGDFSTWVTYSFTTEEQPVTPCVAPTNISAANITHEDADLSWDADAANSFEYVLNEDAAEPAAVGTAIAANTLNATDLEANTTYYFHLRKDCGNGNFSEWVSYSFTTEEQPVTPCVAPTNISAANITHEDADLSWDADAANSFEYVLNEDAAEPTAAGTAIAANTLNATDLEANTTYYFHLRKDCGDGNFSEWVTYNFTTEEQPVTPCTTPSNLVSSNVTNTTATLNWAADGTNTFEYILNENAAEPTTAGTAISQNSYTTNNLSGNTRYYFHVRKNCGNGNYSEWITVDFKTSSLGVDPIHETLFSIFPNPASEIVTIQTQHAEGVLILSGLNGQQLLSVDLKHANTIDVSSFAKGVYLLTHQVNGKVSSSQKLIIE